MTSPLVGVALPLPVAEPYTYAVPDTLADQVVAGMRVVVPVRRTEMVGVVTETSAPTPAAAVRELLAVPDNEPSLSAELLQLAAQAARYYGAPLGLMLRAMLPSAMWGKSRLELVATGHRAVRLGGTAGQLLDWLAQREGRATLTAAARAMKRPVWDVVARLQRIGAVNVDVLPPDVDAAVTTARIATLQGDRLSLVQRDAQFKRARAQRALYEALESHGGTAGVTELLRQTGVTDGPLRALAAAGLVSISDVPVARDPFNTFPTVAPPTSLTMMQRDALRQLREVAAGESALLFGVTGSGKTLVYLEFIREILAQQRGAIILVPEIALTPQTVARVRGAFGDQVAVLHSALSEGERADAWRALRSGDRRVAVGARSAAFAPVDRLGAIIIDEEHEASYKNGETPRYHAREIALMRARIESAVVIAGSATPSVESWQRASNGTLVQLPERIEQRALPPVELIDLRSSPQSSAVVSTVPWTERLDQEVELALTRNEQVLLLLNRRGWAAFMQCTACGEAIECPNCSISLTVHRHPDALRCHYCDHREDIPAACPHCGGTTTRHSGAGTQQLERLILERFPSATTARMDLDTTSGRWAHHHILERVGRGEVDILIGTQMIAKGIDFPNVTLVGVVDADTALHLPDFRAAERTFQLVAQVAGRAGRGPRGGKVLVQSRQPTHAALQYAAQHDSSGFLAEELEARRFPAYPPHTQLVHLVVSGVDQDAVRERATALAEWSERSIARAELAIAVVGPAACPLERIKNRWRWHLILKGPQAAIGRWVRAAAPRLGNLRGDVRVSIDRDPMSLL